MIFHRFSLNLWSYQISGKISGCGSHLPDICSRTKSRSSIYRYLVLVWICQKRPDFHENCFSYVSGIIVVKEKVVSGTDCFLLLSSFWEPLLLLVYVYIYLYIYMQKYVYVIVKWNGGIFDLVFHFSEKLPNVWPK